MLNWLKSLNWTLAIAVISLIFGAIFGGISGMESIFRNKPILKGEIIHLVAGDIAQPIKIKGEYHPTSLLLYFYITNYKEKPVVLLNRYKLLLKIGGKKIEVKPYYWNPDKIFFHFVDNKKPQGFDFKKDYLIAKGVMPPVTYGSIVKGWVSFVIPFAKEEIMKNGTEFILFAEDAFKRQHKIKYVFQKDNKGAMFFPISGMGSGE